METSVTIAATPSTHITVTPYGASLSGDLSPDEFREALSQLRAVKDAYHSALADLVAYGRNKFGDEHVEATLEQLHFEHADCLRAAQIGQMTLEFRTGKALTNEHYFVLGQHLEEEHQRESWADLAAKHGLTALELRHSIARGKVTRTAEIERQSGKNTGIHNIQSVAFDFERWERQVGGEDEILKWPPARREQVLATLEPVARLVDKLRSAK